MELEVYPFDSRGEAIIFEHVVHQKMTDSQYPIPPEHKFPGYSEVFSKRSNLDKVRNDPILLRGGRLANDGISVSATTSTTNRVVNQR